MSDSDRNAFKLKKIDDHYLLRIVACIDLVDVVNLGDKIRISLYLAKPTPN